MCALVLNFVLYFYFYISAKVLNFVLNFYFYLHYLHVQYLQYMNSTAVIRYFKNTVNLFIHIARIPIGDSPRVHPNILKCLLHSPVAKGYRLVVIASRAMVCKTPTYYLILESLAYARGCVILRSHILILLLLILLIFHHIHS